MPFELTTFALTLLSVGTIALLVLCVYYIYFFTGIKPKNNISSNDIPVSVIIAARNEKYNLERNLPSILNQDYRNFEVVVINDGSWDGTKELLKEFAASSAKLKIVTLELDEKFHRGKKFALTMGIKAAANEHLLFADADCTPCSDQWISSMVSPMKNNEVQVVLGNSPLMVKNNVLGSMVNYETFHTAIQYLGYANRGLPYMGVGRNLAYKKSLFFENKGFATHQHILSGDDDLFVQEVANGKNTAIALNPASFTLSPGPSSVSAWLKQKTRHLSTGKLYSGKYKMLLGTYSVFQLLIYICAVVYMFLYPSMWYVGIGLLALKWIVQWIVIYRPSQRLGYSKVGYALPYYDILYTLFLLFFGLAKPFLKPKTWN